MRLYFKDKNKVIAEIEKKRKREKERESCFSRDTNVLDIETAFL